MPQRRILFPREHGAWAMLLVPYLVGLGVAGGWNVKALLLLGAILSLYLARYPLFLWARSQFAQFPPGSLLSLALFLGLGLFFGVLLLVKYQLWLLAAIGAAATSLLPVDLYQAGRRRAHPELRQFLGIAALTLSGPAALYTSRGTLSWDALALWLLSVVYFGTGVLYVRMKLSQQARRPSARPLAWYQGATLAGIALLAYLGLLPAFTLVAFVPITVQSLLGFRPRPGKLSVKKLGFTQVGHSILFGGLLTWAFRLQGF